MRVVALLCGVRRQPSGDELLAGLGPCERAALSAALRVARASGGAVTALALGGPAQDQVLRRALAAGAGRAIRVFSPELEGASIEVRAAALAAVTSSIGFDLVLAGQRSSNWGSGLTGPAVAHYLGAPHFVAVRVIEPAGERVRLEQRWGDRALEVMLRPPLLAAMFPPVGGQAVALPAPEEGGAAPEAASIEIVGLADLHLQIGGARARVREGVSEAEAKAEALAPQRPRLCADGRALLAELRRTGLLR